MSEFSKRIFLGPTNGVIEVDNFGFSEPLEVCLDVFDTSAGAGEGNRGCVWLTAAEALELADALRKAAEG